MESVASTQPHAALDHHLKGRGRLSDLAVRRGELSETANPNKVNSAIAPWGIDRKIAVCPRGKSFGVTRALLVLSMFFHQQSQEHQHVISRIFLPRFSRVFVPGRSRKSHRRHGRGGV